MAVVSCEIVLTISTMSTCFFFSLDDLYVVFIIFNCKKKPGKVDDGLGDAICCNSSAFFCNDYTQDAASLVDF